MLLELKLRAYIKKKALVLYLELQWFVFFYIILVVHGNKLKISFRRVDIGEWSRQLMWLERLRRVCKWHEYDRENELHSLSRSLAWYSLNKVFLKIKSLKKKKKKKKYSCRATLFTLEWTNSKKAHCYSPRAVTIIPYFVI